MPPAVELDRSAVLTGGAPAPAPLLLLLHGFGSDERDLPGLTAHLPAALGWASLPGPFPASPYPGAPGRAWFPITTPGSPDPEPVHAATAAILEWLDQTVPADRPVVPLGFSQGGLMVTQLLRARPERFAAGVVLSGFVLAGEQPHDDELADVPVFYGRGDADGVIATDAVERTDAWLPAHTKATVRVYPGLPHSVSAAELADVATFLEAALTA